MSRAVLATEAFTPVHVSSAGAHPSFASAHATFAVSCALNVERVSRADPPPRSPEAESDRSETRLGTPETPSPPPPHRTTCA